MRRTLPILLGSALLLAVAAGAFLYLRERRTAMEAVLIPTLDLGVVEQRKPDFSARLIGESNGIQIHYFTASEATTGFTAPKDVHMLFDCPETTAAGVEVVIAHGDRELFRTARYWGYEYSGNENANKAAGKRGTELFDGRFWLSQGELDVTGAQFGYLDTPGMRMTASKRYYLMSSADLRVSCLDSDRDSLNDGREDMNGNGVVDAGETNPRDADTDDDGYGDGSEIGLGIDPTNPDTDGDGLQDGTEIGLTAGYVPDTDLAVFIPDADPETTTDPFNPDTDGGGTSDGDEDRNRNGAVDGNETNPNDPLDDVPAVCGDGIIAGSEECDDGNAAGEDGCSAQCAVETGWTCEGAPSVCEVLVPERP